MIYVFDGKVITLSLLFKNLNLFWICCELPESFLFYTLYWCSKMTWLRIPWGPRKLDRRKETEEYICGFKHAFFSYFKQPQKNEGSFFVVEQ